MRSKPCKFSTNDVSGGHGHVEAKGARVAVASRIRIDSLYARPATKWVFAGVSEAEKLRLFLSNSTACPDATTFLKAAEDWSQK